ncbi:MAG: DUF4271 domain-containing protein [Chitinophagaceae bacterium]|nr:DUF4271 domain-containing protein [Chitinophagaceae bacterium]
MKYFLFFIVLLFASQSYAQSPIDSLVAHHPYFNFDGQPERLIIQERNTENNNEGIFYFIISLVVYIALMRLIFYKYISTMFTLFFRSTLRQQQLREQMLQARLPSLLMNIFFVVVFGTYFALLAQHFNLSHKDFWQILLTAIVIIAIIYVGKFLVLNILGWIFGIGNASDAYLFIVFMINKMMAIFLLPFVVLLAFPTPYIVTVVLTLSYILIGGMFIYRFIISYRPVRNEIKLSRLHFFLYLCAFEIAPLLLIYKVLLTLEVSRL